MKIVSVILSLLLFFPKPFFFPSENGEGKRDIIIEKDEVYKKDIISFGSEVTIHGTAKKSVIVIGGSINVYGTVGNDVIGIGSKVSVLKGAKISGDLLVIGGRLRKDRETCIEGDMFYFKPGRNFPAFIKSAFKGAFSFPSRPHEILLKIVALLSWFLLVLIFNFIFPKNVLEASLLMDKNIWKSLLIGFLSLLIVLVFLVFFGFLSLFLIGIPFLIIVLIGLFLAVLFGRTAIFHWLGSTILKALKRDEFSNTIAVLSGFIVFFILSFIPFFSLLMRIFVDLCGIGIVVISKFGTRRI
jgi:hypothetical protein